MGVSDTEGFFKYLRTIFMLSDQTKVHEIYWEFVSEKPGAFRDLVNLTANCQHQDSVQLLELLSETKKLDNATKSYTEAVLKKKRGQQPIQEQASIKSDAVIITPEPVGITLGTSGPTVLITPTIYGNRPAPATAESKKPVDALNYRTYANAFGDLIANPETRTPLTIGVCAPWGRGKTVLLGYIKDRIKEKSSDETKCQCIDFNAWMYTKAEQLWAEFYSTILNSVEKGLSIGQKVQFKWYFFRRANPKLVFIWKFSLAAIVVCYLLLLLLEDQLLPVFSYIKAWWPTLLSLPLAGVLWKYFRSLSKDIFSKSKMPKFRAALGVQHEIFKYFDIVRDWLVNISPKRIVVFIDDIDRCSPGKIMQMLEAIKLLLDTPNFVFVLAMDARVVRLAVGQHYKFMAETQAEREKMGRSYLEKIVQIPFALPQASPEDLVNMKNELFKGLLEKENKKKEHQELRQGDKPEAKVEEAEDTAADRKTPSPEEKLEDGEKPGPEGGRPEKPSDSGTPPPPEPKVDPELEMKLSKEENETLDAILKERFELSPRLLIRLKNVYLIAKHLHQADTNEPPPPEFMHWIAYSVGFPFVSKAVAEACEKNDWDKEWSQVFDDIRSTMEKKHDEYNFDPVELEALQIRLSIHITHPREIKKFIKHANCFNLVLD